MTRRALMLVALITLLLTTTFVVQVAAQDAAATTAADEAEPADDSRFSIETFLEVPVLNSPAVSPDGKQVAYLWTRRDLAEDERLTQLWLADADKGTVRRLSFGDDRPGQLAWRPDGALSFVRAVDGSPQVWINPLDGSEPRPVTDLEGGVSGYWWSPDGKRLAVLAEGADPEDGDDVDDAASDDDADDDDAAGETEETDDAEECDSENDPDRADWTVFDRLEQPDEYHQLWIVAAQDDGADDAEVEVEPRQLTEAPLHPYHVAWSPDGQTIALTYNARFSSLVDEEQQVGLLDVASGELTAITPADRHSSLGAFSPDGRQLAYFTDLKAELRAYLNLKDVVLRDLETGQTRVLTETTQLALGGTGPSICIGSM